MCVFALSVAYGAEKIKENVREKIDCNSLSVNIEVNEIVLAPYVVGVLLDLLQ